MTHDYAERAKEMEAWGQERERNPEPTAMTIESRVPTKWRFVDLETLDVWRWDAEEKRFRREGLLSKLELMMVDQVRFPCERP
jgi:hypothetical protein